MEDKQMLTKMANTIRFLSADMIQKANSGHPGVCFGLADVLTVLSSHLKHNPNNPKWLNRDRLIFSGGHASAMIYSWLHLTGYDISADDLKNFRQLDSKTPGHPEYPEVPGVEKKDIDLEVTENTLTIKVDKDKRKYYKEVELPCEVDADSAKASYQNGILDIELKKSKPRKKGKKVSIN